MKFFYLSSTPNPEGKFEIHDRECRAIPGSLDRDYLGPFNNGPEAMRKAVSINPEACLCEDCCNTPFHPINFRNRNSEGI
ncbi:hypothetical protein [Algoriphagus vanfongensis]|uniref:hypothetical protein n=1 Tax=Algoriphagus vanfongensis TaxID=426371 RepID=UPI0004169A38|nr:hypothetical protein [Algoriphagus vanfongensis]